MRQTTADAARSLKITEKSVSELCRTGALPGAQIVLREWVRIRRGKTRTYHRWSWEIPADAIRARRRRLMQWVR